MRTFEEILENDIKYIENVLIREKDRLEYDDWFGGWCIGETPFIDFLYEEENTILNPKELEGYAEEIIEDKLGLKK